MRTPTKSYQINLPCSHLARKPLISGDSNSAMGNSSSRRSPWCSAHLGTRHTIQGRPMIHQSFYMLKSFCFQWRLGSRIPLSLNGSDAGEQTLCGWLWAVAGAVPPCSGCREPPEPQCSHGDMHSYRCHPALPQQHHKMSRGAKCCLLFKHSKV